MLTLSKFWMHCICKYPRSFWIGDYNRKNEFFETLDITPHYLCVKVVYDKVYK
jgi:hypothetical protein